MSTLTAADFSNYLAQLAAIELPEPIARLRRIRFWLNRVKEATVAEGATEEARNLFVWANQIVILGIEDEIRRALELFFSAWTDVQKDENARLLINFTLHFFGPGDSEDQTPKTWTAAHEQQLMSALDHELASASARILVETMQPAVISHTDELGDFEELVITKPSGIDYSPHLLALAATPSFRAICADLGLTDPNLPADESTSSEPPPESPL